MTEPELPTTAGPRVLAPALAVVPVVFLLVFFAWPLAAIVRRGAYGAGVIDLVRDRGLRNVAWFTVWQAALSTVLTLAVGIPGAHVFARLRFRGQRVLLALVTVPFVLPTVVVGAAFLAVLPPSWHQTIPAVLVAHVFFNYAVVVRTVGALWRNLDPRLEDAARVLGASRIQAFRLVTWPLLRPAVAAAASIVFLFTFTSFGVVLLLGGPRHPTLEVEIYQRTTGLLDLRGAAGIALGQLVAMAALLVWWSRGQERRARALSLQAAPVAARPVHGVGPRLWLGGNLLVMAVLLGWPLARLVERSFAVPGGHGLAFYRALSHTGRGTSRALDPWGSIRTSLAYGAAATAIAVVVGLLAALSISLGRRGRRALDAGIMLPLGTSAVTIGFGLLITMNRPPLDLRASPVIVPIGQALVATPFVVRVVLPVLRSIDPRLREAAAVLGATPGRAWRAVDLVMARRALVTGAAFAFAVSLGEFGATSLLARRSTPTLPIAIADLLGRPGALNVGQAYALATILAGLTALVMLLAERGPRAGASF